MSKEIQERLSRLRELMKENELDAFLINGSDPHMSEYVPERWQSRAYISGFTGSFGWLAITIDKAVLWTDSRYYLQANEQLKDTGFEMLKARDLETLPIDEWVANELKDGNTCAFDGACYSTAEVKLLEHTLKQKNIELK